MRRGDRVEPPGQNSSTPASAGGCALHLLISLMLSRPAPTALCPVSYFPMTTTRLNSCPPSPPPTQPPSPPKARATPTVHPGPKSPALSSLRQHSQPCSALTPNGRASKQWLSVHPHPQPIRPGLIVPGTQLVWDWLMCSGHWTLTTPFLSARCYPQPPTVSSPGSVPIIINHWAQPAPKPSPTRDCENRRE